MNWQVLILAASRGPDDPLAKHFGLLHKCLLNISGKPMLQHVYDALRQEPRITEISICIEDENIAHKALGPSRPARITKPRNSAAASALANVSDMQFPILLTTGDHALLTPQMLADFISASEAANADLTVGLASAETILQAFPHAKRTFLKFGQDRVSGCNLYGLKNANALKALEFWQHIEKNRKSPFKLMRAFGLKVLWSWATGRTNLQHAFGLASQKLGLHAAPILMAQAEAAVDVDKPADKALAEEILAARGD